MEREEKRIFTWALILALMLLLALGCNKDDGPVPPKPDVIDTPDPKLDPENQAPNSFLLLTPEMDSTIVNRTPTFSWQQATDPDGDTVTYDLYLDTHENPNSLLAENLSTTSFGLAESLDFETQYYWKVVAKDDKGAAIESSQSLMISIPNKLLTIYDSNRESGSSEFEYQNEDLIRFGQYFPDYQENPSKIERLKHINSQPTHYYEYTDSGKQRMVYNGDATYGDRWIFEYEENDRVTSIDKETRSDNGKGGVEIVVKRSVFIYNDAIGIHPEQIEIYERDKILFRYTLQWEGNNIVSILVEGKGMSGNELQFQWRIKIEYDDNINPYYMIISNQFGFAPFHVLTDTPSELESFDFQIFKWQSFNNITAFEEFDIANPDEPNEGYRVEYDYSDDYYPKSASFFSISNNTTNQINWSYLDE